MSINNDALTAYFNEVRYLHIITNDVITNLNRTNDNLHNVMLEYLNSTRNRNQLQLQIWRSPNYFSSRTNPWSISKI